MLIKHKNFLAREEYGTCLLNRLKEQNLLRGFYVSFSYGYICKRAI